MSMLTLLYNVCKDSSWRRFPGKVTIILFMLCGLTLNDIPISGDITPRMVSAAEHVKAARPDENLSLQAKSSQDVVTARLAIGDKAVSNLNFDWDFEDILAFSVPEIPIEDVNHDAESAYQNTLRTLKIQPTSLVRHLQELYRTAPQSMYPSGRKDEAHPSTSHRDEEEMIRRKALHGLSRLAKKGDANATYHLGRLLGAQERGVAIAAALELHIHGKLTQAHQQILQTRNFPSTFKEMVSEQLYHIPQTEQDANRDRRQHAFFTLYPLN